MIVSIIMPYNKGIHFLKDAFESIRNALDECSYEEKTKCQWELLIVIDDLSSKPDNIIPGKKVRNASEYRQEALILCDEYQKIYGDYILLRTIQTKGRYNVAMLRNKGVKEANGEYIYFMDSDDFVDVKTMRAMLQTVIKDEYDVVTGPIASTLFKYETYMNNKRDDVYSKDIFTNMYSSDFSIVNTLINSNYLRELELEFNPDSELYPDIEYTATVYSKSKKICFVPDMLYIKRKHNDSIQFPSLDQVQSAGRKIEFKTNLQKVKKASKGNNLISHAVHEINKRNKKRIIDKRITQVKNFFRKPTFLFRVLYKSIFNKMSVKDNWIVFESFLGKNYSDSCKYIYEYMYSTFNDEYRYIWVINDSKTEIPGNVTKVKYLGIRWFYYVARSKFYVNNMRQPIWLNRRKETVMLETWHGTPLKRLVFDMEDVHAATPSYKMDMYSQSRRWDYLISDNPFSSEVFQSCFLFPRERIIETGYPRNDILYSLKKQEIAENLKKKIGISKEKKVILYAPTWRDDEFYGPGMYQFALKLDLKKLKERIGQEYVILLRTHYFIADSIDITGLDGFAYNVSRYNDIAELYLISDICITDYSSVFFDFANLKRPILFYVYDFIKYKDELRGFYIDMENELPGPLIDSEEKVIEAIENIESISKKYAKKYDEFYARFCCVDDGYASKRVVNTVFGRGDE